MTGGPHDLRLAESLALGKYGADGQEKPWGDPAGGATGDQSLHQDISGDTMLLPTPGICEGVQALLYYSDVETNGGVSTRAIRHHL